MRSMGPKNRGAWLGLALLVLGCLSAAPGQSQSTDTPWLGVSMQSLNDGLRDGMSYQGNGVLVSRVVDGSPADRAGLRKGDVIASVNGRSVDSPDELTRIVRDQRVGETVSLTVFRDGNRRTLSARLGNWPDGNELEATPEDTPRPRSRSGNEGDFEWYEGKDFEELKDKELLKEKDFKERKELEGVFVVRDNKAVFVPVKTGIAGEKYFEVTSGVAVGDQVIVGPFSSVRELGDGVAVKIEKAPTGSGSGKT